MNPQHAGQIEQPALVLRKRAVCKLLGFSTAHLDRLRADGGFPAPILLGEQARGWTRESIDAWLASRPSAQH